MRTSKTFSIRFWVNPKKAQNNSALLYARVTVNQQRVEISLKRKVSLDLWDSKNKKIRSFFRSQTDQSVLGRDTSIALSNISGSKISRRANNSKEDQD